MPYFLYKIFPEKKLEYIEEHNEYREAKTRARALRSEMSESDNYIVKMIFAKDTGQAEHLLTQEREPRPMGEDA